MRQKEDNILRIAEMYKKSFKDTELDFEESEDDDLFSVFADVIKDYFKIMRRCSKEGVDVGSSDIDVYKDDFQSSSAEQREEIIERIKERIVSLMELCEKVPEDIEKKYTEQDLVSIFDN